MCIYTYYKFKLLKVIRFVKSKKTLVQNNHFSYHSVSETWEFTLPILSQGPKPHYEIITLHL